MPKKSRDDFKAAFKTVKKPKPPSNDAKANKIAIDKAIDKGDPDGTLDGLIKQLVDSGERDYVVKLVAYKYAKHYDDGSEKRPSWATKFPDDIVRDAMAIVVPDGFDKPLTKKALDRAVGGNVTVANNAKFGSLTVTDTWTTGGAVTINCQEAPTTAPTMNVTSFFEGFGTPWKSAS